MPVPPVIWTIQTIHIHLSVVPFEFFLALPLTLRILRTFIDIRFSVTPPPMAFIGCCSLHHAEIKNADNLRRTKSPWDYEFIEDLFGKLMLRALGQYHLQGIQSCWLRMSVHHCRKVGRKSPVFE
jgi:hypothetical protein